MNDTPRESRRAFGARVLPDDPAGELEATVKVFCDQFHQNHRDNEPAFAIAYRRLFKTVYRRAGNAGRQRLFNTIAKNIKTSQLVEEFVDQLLSRMSAEDVTRFRAQVHRVETLQYETADVRLDVGSVIEARETVNFPERWPDVVTWIEGLPQGAVLYDLAAGNGIRSVLAAAQPNKSLTIVAFEPGYENFAALCENVRLNEVSDRVIPIHGAVGATSGLDTFHYRTLERGADQNCLAQPVDRRGNPFLPVASMTSVRWSIDDAITRLALPAPTHLCLAVDGAELDVLAGARGTLAGPGVTNLLLIGDAAAATRVRGWCRDAPWTEVPAPPPDTPSAVQAVRFVREVRP
jgi:FkbM family methyltransferase